MRQFKAIYDDSPFGVLRADRDGSATYANPAWHEITGLDPKDLLGFGWINAIHPEHRQRVLDQWREACSAGRTLDISYCIVRQDGTPRHLRVRSRPLGAARNASTDYVAIALDMTEQVLAERRLRRNNELLGAVLDNIPCDVSVYASDGSLVLDKHKTRWMLSVPGNGDDRPITDFGTLALHGGGPTTYSASATSTDESVGGTEVDYAPRVREEIQHDGRVLEIRDAPMPMGGVITTSTDVTHHKSLIESLQHAKAAAEQAAAAKAAFLATMSHEIRTPMNGVVGMINVLLDSRLTPDQREIVEVMRESSESLLVVLNDILDYSKIESGHMELEWLPLNLQQVVDQTVLLMRPKAQEKKLLLDADIDADLPPLILGDRTRIKQVLVNLISNAIKFTERGQVRVCVRKAKGDRGDGTGDLSKIAISIADTGVGIPHDKIDSIFKPFVQADSSTARRYGGAGLGLAIAKRLVEAMGGSIALKSEPGKGTEVRFDFLAETAVPRSRAAGSQQAPLWGKRALLLTDSRSDVRVLVAQMKRWGIVVQSTRSSAEARAVLRGTHDIDLIVAASHRFLGSRGLEFVRKLRDQGITVPAVLLARDDEEERADSALRTWIIGRTSTESQLYDALVGAVHCSRDPSLDVVPKPLFDNSMGQTMPLRILLAEDNEINRKVVLRMLASFGYEADLAYDGAQVIEAVQRRNYDLVLMDIQMPQVDGIEATRFIVQNIPLDRRPRIVAMSANVMREHVEAALAAGASQYIGKPFAPSELREALELSVRDSATGTESREDARPEQSLQVLSVERVRGHLQADQDGQFLRELTASFANTARDLLARLTRAVHAEDMPTLRAIVHEYSGMCAVIGAEKLTNLLLGLRDAARAGNVARTAVILAQCRSAQDETIGALAAVVSQAAGRAPSSRDGPSGAK